MWIKIILVREKKEDLDLKIFFSFSEEVLNSFGFGYNLEINSLNSDVSSESFDSFEEFLFIIKFIFDFIGEVLVSSGNLSFFVIFTFFFFLELSREFFYLWGCVFGELYFFGKMRGGIAGKFGDKGSGDVFLDGRRRVYRCYFNGCRKVYIKSFYLKVY